MKKLLSLLLCIGFLSAKEEAIIEPQEIQSIELDVEKISEAFGHLLGKNLESMGMKFDIAKVSKGLQDASEGKPAPMTEMECIQAMATSQEIVYKEAAAKNLKEAEAFLATNKTTSGMQVLEEGKLQYTVTHEGKGVSIDENSSPLIRYTAKLLDGSVFGASTEDELFHLDESLPGLKKGLLGMKEGEKRTLFIHPDLGFGTRGNFPPNSLLTFEIEVVQANAPHAESFDALSTTTPKSKGNPEIASPFEEPKVLR